MRWTHATPARCGPSPSSAPASRRRRSAPAPCSRSRPPAGCRCDARRAGRRPLRDPVAAVAPAPPRIDERAVVLLQRVGEALVDARRTEALVLPQRDDEQLAAFAVVPADEDDVAIDEVAD